MATKKHIRAGFSLIELAIVITIVGVLLYTVLSVTGSQGEMRKFRETQDKLTKIENALIVYYKMNGHLPCPNSGTTPDDATLGVDNVTDGTYVGSNAVGSTAISCDGSVANTGGTHPDAYIGVAPVKALRLPDNVMYDGWGRRITYAVSRYCIARNNWQTIADTAYTNTYKCSNNGVITAAALNTDSGGTIRILDGNNGTTTWMVTQSYAAYALISHGKNGIGAWQRGGIGKITGDTSDYEENNGSLNATGTVDSYDVNFFDMPINDGSIAGNYIDDMVRFKTPAQIDYDSNY